MHNPSTFRRLVVPALVAAALVAATPAAAAPHRARLSADLEDHLAADSQTIDVIVHGTRAEVRALAARYNLRVGKFLKSGAVLRLTAGQLAALRQDESVDHLSSDVRYRSATSVTAQSIGADQLWAGAMRRAISGVGVGVAVIDSGVDPHHVALRGRVTAMVDFTGGDGIDRFGHGTHVAAIIAGQGGGGVDTRAYLGMAPGAYIVSLRVLGDDGSGRASDVIEAIDWAIEHRKAQNIRVINLSIGAPVLQPYRDDPVGEAVERAVSAGLIVVAAAGNYGQTADGRRVFGGITSPGNHPSVITVGAVDTQGTAQRSDDRVAAFSSRGPTRYDMVLKPDLVAPGSRIVSAGAAGSYLVTTYRERHVAGSGAEGYFQLSGTSMAAGVVSGAVALLLEQQPKLSPRDAKRVLQVTSEFLASEGLVGGGAGSLNVLAAAKYTLAPKKTLPTSTIIADESIEPSGFYTRVSLKPSSDSIFWGTSNGSIFLGTSKDSIFWGTGDSIFWGTSGDSIFWGTGGDSIFWGTGGDSIFWGTGGDSIFWGTSGDSIFWGTSGDSIFWGTSGDSIFWGTTTSVRRTRSGFDLLKR